MNVMKNKKWIKPEMLRITLNPEQAVLTCCDTLSRNEDDHGEQCQGVCGTMGVEFLSS